MNLKIVYKITSIFLSIMYFVFHLDRGRRLGVKASEINVGLLRDKKLTEVVWEAKDL